MAHSGLDSGTITLLLEGARSGKTEDAEELFSIIYDDLRRLAQNHVGKKSDRLFQATDLVNATCVKMLARITSGAKDRQHLFGLLRRAMHDVYVDTVRAQDAHRRGGLHRSVPLVDLGTGNSDLTSDVLDLFAALDELERVDPEGVQVVMLRFFSGCTLAESAVLMGCSVAIVRRHWDYARSWLHDRLSS